MTASYKATHRRLSRTRGPARNLSCIKCGNPADEWAYDGTDPDELRGSAGSSKHDVVARYSLDLARYQPMCRSCHRSSDPQRNRGKTHCVNGHEFTPENTYTWRGHRNCRICNRAHAAVVRAKGVQP